MKTNEETLTYLNQGQPYEIKLKKLGDLTHSRGKIFKVSTPFIIIFKVVFVLVDFYRDLVVHFGYRIYIRRFL